MKQPNLITCFYKWVPVFFLLVVLYPGTLNAQLKITDFVLFGGNGLCPGGPSQKAPASPGCAVQIGPASNVQGGSVGSYTLVKSTGNVTLNSNIYSGGTILLANSNVVTGKISAADSQSKAGTVLSVGSAAKISGNID